jgi:WD40 repeat protein
MDGINSLSLSADGKRALAGTPFNVAILWDAQRGELLRTFTGHEGAVVAVSLSTDGKRALTGSYDKTAILWDVASGKKLRTFAGHTD